MAFQTSRDSGATTNFVPTNESQLWVAYRREVVARKPTLAVSRALLPGADPRMGSSGWGPDFGAVYLNDRAVIAMIGNAATTVARTQAQTPPRPTTSPKRTRTQAKA